MFLRSQGEALLQEAYRKLYGRPVDVENPTLFSEKLHAWMIRQHRQPDPRFGPLVDKLASRDYVRERLGPEYLTELYWQGSEPREFPFDDLPDRYVIKPTHSSGHVIIGGPDLDRGQAVEAMEGWLQENYYWVCREYQNLEIPPRIMVEECVDDGTEGGPFDYSIWTINGTPKLAQLRKFPRVVNQFYDLEWNLLPLKARKHIPDIEMARPPQLEEMVKAAERLSEGLEYVRVDFYCPPGRVLYSELTLTPGAGRSRYHPPEWDLKLGEMWD